MATMEAKIAPWKRQEVDELAQLLKQSPVVAVARIDKLPSRQFQMVREKIRDHAEIRVAKNRLLLRAMDEVTGERENLDELEQHLDGQTALILSDINPFKLFKAIEGSKAKAPAKAGDLAPHDIEVKKGDTPFKPGPIVGDLQKAGLPAKIEGGKVVISADKVVAKAGTAISADLANALARLEIYPMTVGLDLTAVWEEGTVFGRDVLAVDDEAVLAELLQAHARAFALAVGTAFPTTKTLPATLTKAHARARAVALEAAFPAEGIVDLLLARAEGQLLSVASKLSEDALDDELKAKLAAAPKAAAPAAAAPAAEASNDEDEEEEVSEEEAAAGLGALFG